MHGLKSIAGYLLIAFCSCAQADGLGGIVEDYKNVIARGRLAHVLDIDNDSLMLNRNDGFYTSGLFYTQRYTMRDASKMTVSGWRIGQQLYTASDINLPPQLVGPPDRPYAGWLFGGAFREAHWADGSSVRFGIDIGCLGPCAGGESTQKTLHRILNQPLPQAWSRQVKNELGAMLYADIAPLRWMLGSFADITPGVKARFGNIHTDIGANVTVRAGRLNIFPDQPSLYGFMRADARVVGYDATLQGGYFSSDNPHTVAPKWHVGEIEGGIAWNNGKYGIRASIVRRSNDVGGIANIDSAQTYGRLQFSYAE